MLVYSLFFLLFSFLGLLEAKSSTGDSVLVVVEPARRDEYSIFFDGLEENGYSLTFRAPKDVEPLVMEDDIPSFAHVVLFAGNNKNFASDITPQSVVKILESGTNVLIALSQKQTFLTSLASEFSLILPPPQTPLISYFPKRDEPVNVVPIDVPSSIITDGTAPVWFSGVPFVLGNNPRLFSILDAPLESFAADSGSGADALVDAAEKGGEGLWAGSQLSVVAGFQVTGGGRVAWVGGAEMFSDEYAKKQALTGAMSGNTQFIRDLSAWTFQETNVYRIDRTTHHLVNTTKSLELYTTNNMITYSAFISKFERTTGTWAPYSGIEDMQLEFTMLDPHIRTALLPVAGKRGMYSVTFRAPDRHGVFKFVINYKRKGFTHLLSSTTIPVVPPRHDGYPRFLSAAWPYYIGAISTSAAFFLFSALWLAGDARDMILKKGKGKVE